jgi:DNA recombination-dependent growth factor C
LVTQEDRTVNISKACVYNSEAQELVEQGSYVTQLSVLYDGMVSFTLKDDFTLNGLKFSSTLFDDGAECETEEDKLKAMAGDEVLILQELSKVVDEIIKRCSEVEEGE